MARLMIVDDERSVRELIARYTQTQGHESVTYSTGKSALEGLEQSKPDLLLVDLRIGDMDGLEVIKTCKEKCPSLPVIMITGHGSVETAVEAMRLGAYDYLTKPFELDDLGRTIQAALAETGAAPLSAAAEIPPAQAGSVIGRSEAVRKIQMLIDRIGGRPANVVFEGEYGVGKISFARQLHAAGPSARHPFRTIHCSALPEALLEQELSGGEGVRNAFERTAGGTLVLEEVDTLPPRLQAILQDQLGDGHGKPFRVIATTTRALDTMVRKGEFRSDLFYRLAVIPVAVPALRDRAEDILPLAEHFLAEIAAKVPGAPQRIEKEAKKLLQKYPWPGNVGELQNSIQRACALATGPEITAMELPARLRQPAPPIPPPGQNNGDPEAVLPVGSSLNKFIREQERRFIKATLASVGGNKEQAAGILEISLATLYRKLDE